MSLDCWRKLGYTERTYQKLSSGPSCCEATLLTTMLPIIIQSYIVYIVDLYEITVIQHIIDRCIQYNSDHYGEGNDLCPTV